MEMIKCPICNADSFTFLFQSKDYIHNIEGDFNLVKCNSCDLILTNPRPDKKEILEYYPDSYKPYVFNKNKIERNYKLKTKFKTLSKFLNTGSKIFPESKDGAKMLEIGCGGGEFLYEYFLRNPTHYAVGTDFNGKVVEDLRKQGLNVICSDLSKLELKSDYFDFVFGWMVLEHIHNINKALNEIRRVIKEDGKFYFSVPNASSREFNFFKDCGYSLHVPAHLYHFTPATIKKMLAKHGFEIEKIIYQRNTLNIFKSFLNIVKKNTRSLWLLDIIRKIEHCSRLNYIILVATLPLGVILSFLKQSGRITIIARANNTKK